MNRTLGTNERNFLDVTALKDIAIRANPFHKNLVAKRELESYLMALGKQYPDKGITASSSRYSYKKLCVLLRQVGGTQLRYNATVKGKTVNLNMWIMREHELYLAMPRGELIEEWKRTCVDHDPRQ